MNVEIRRDDEGMVDEIVAPGVHLERMDGHYIHLVIGDVHVQLTTDCKDIYILAERDKPLL